MRAWFDSKLEILVLVGSVALIVVGIYFGNQESNACEAKGGTYYCPYKSQCVCLAKGMVIP